MKGRGKGYQAQGDEEDWNEDDDEEQGNNMSIVSFAINPLAVSPLPRRSHTTWQPSVFA